MKIEFPNEKLKGKVFERPPVVSLDSEYAHHAYQYGFTSQPLGSIAPALIVYPACDADILLVIEYAKQAGIAIALRSGGHQYVGASSTCGPNIQLDMSGLEFEGPKHEYPYRQWSFDSRTGLFACGVGVLLAELTAEMAKLGLFMPHGECGAVGFGGHCQSGGYSTLSRSEGLLVDYIQSYHIITADGEKRVVRRDTTDPHEAELFFTLAGGSPGNFGVVLSATFRPKRDEDYTVHSNKRVMIYCPERLTQLVELTAKLQDPTSPYNAAEFQVYTLMLGADWGRTDSYDYDNTMRAEEPHLFGRATQIFYPVTTIILTAHVIRKGRNLPVTPTMRAFFAEVQAACVVAGRVDNFPLPQPKFMSSAFFNWVLHVSQGSQMAPWEAIVESNREWNCGGSSVNWFDFEDLVTLPDGRKVPQCPSWLLYQHMFLSTTSVREFPRPFVKSLCLFDDKARVVGVGFAEWVTERVELLVSPASLKAHDCRIAFQVGVLSSPYGGFNHPPDNKTAAAWRSSSVFFALDAFYNPAKSSSREYAQQWCEGNFEQACGPKGRFSKQLRLMNWAPFGGLNMDAQRSLYFDSEETYQRVLAVKQRVDPGNLFTPNLWGVGASGVAGGRVGGGQVRFEADHFPDSVLARRRKERGVSSVVKARVGGRRLPSRRGAAAVVLLFAVLGLLVINLLGVAGPGLRG